MEILVLKSSTDKMKTSVNGFNSRIERTEKRIGRVLRELTLSQKRHSAKVIYYMIPFM